MSFLNDFDLGFDEQAVSPVVGVILMVAITVILAAVIGTFVLDLGGQVESNAQAGVTVDGDTVIVNTLGENTDGIYLQASDGTNAWGGPSESDLKGVGASTTLSAGDYTVIGVTADGNENVIQTITIE